LPAAGQLRATMTSAHEAVIANAVEAWWQDVEKETAAVYLTITSDLFAEANRRFEALAVPMVGEVRP
jgi:hypothetical protein